LKSLTKEKNVIISVVIPTYEDWDRLKLCIRSLEQQTLAKENFELIIVDNSTVSIPPESIDLPSNAIVLHEPTPGSYAARNAAIKVAKGEIIAFTDSDCIPRQDWLKNAYTYFQQKSVSRIAGKVELSYEKDKSKNLAELYETVFAFNQKRNVERFGASITANFFTRKENFDRLGLFDQSKKSGEDFGWNIRASKAGLPITYAEDVVVYHPARSSIRELVEKRKRVLGGKKTFQFRTIRDVVREMRYPAILFYMYLFMPIKRLFQAVQLRSFEKLKVLLVITYLYVITNVEYIRLLFGGKPRR